MIDMIERVASAIASVGLDRNVDDQIILMEAARAAIAAMREPTEAMERKLGSEYRLEWLGKP